MPDTKLNPQDAYDVLVAQVHAPVFFEKLARVYNITPQGPDEARELLLMAGQLRNAEEQNKTKQAAYRPTMLAEARRDLTATLSNQGFTPLVEDSHAIKQAAAAAVKNPLIKEAATVFNSYISQELQKIAG